MLAQKRSQRSLSGGMRMHHGTSLLHAHRYDPGHVCNHSDDGGRYAFQAQPDMCRWNCEKLAEALAPVLTLSRARNELAMFDQEFDRCACNSPLRKYFSQHCPRALWVVLYPSDIREAASGSLSGGGPVSSRIRGAASGS